MPTDPEPPAAAEPTDADAVVESEPWQRIRVAAAARASLLQADRDRLDADLDRLRAKAGS